MGGVHAHLLPAGAGQPAQLDGEEQPQQVGEEEHRDGDAEQRADDRRRVDPAAVLAGGQVAQRDADADGEDHREDGELDGAGEAGEELVGHRAAGGAARCRSPAGSPGRGSGGTAPRRAGRARRPGCTRRSWRGWRARPERPTAGPPGRARSQANSRTDSPSRIGISWRSRRTMKRSTRSGQPFSTADDRAGGGRCRRRRGPTTGSVADGDGREVLGGQRAGLQTRDVLGHDERVGACEIGTAGRKSMISPVGLLVQLRPLGRVRLGVGRRPAPRRSPARRTRRTPPCPGRRPLGEERADEVVGVVVVTGPPEEVEVGPAGAAPRPGSPGSRAATSAAMVKPASVRFLLMTSNIAAGSGRYGRLTSVG